MAEGKRSFKRSDGNGFSKMLVDDQKAISKKRNKSTRLSKELQETFGRTFEDFTGTKFDFLPIHFVTYKNNFGQMGTAKVQSDKTRLSTFYKKIQSFFPKIELKEVEVYWAITTELFFAKNHLGKKRSQRALLTRCTRVKKAKEYFDERKIKRVSKGHNKYEELF